MATFRALLAGDAELFSTLHWIDDETIDTGRIISIQGVPTDPDGCHLSNTLNLYPSGCRALLETINTLHAQESPEAVTPDSPGHYFTVPDRSPSQIATHWPDFTEQDTDWLIQRCWLQSSLVTTRTKVCNGHGHILPQTQIRFFDQTPQKSCVLQFNAAICGLNHEFKIAS